MSSKKEILLKEVEIAEEGMYKKKTELERQGLSATEIEKDIVFGVFRGLWKLKIEKLIPLHNDLHKKQSWFYNKKVSKIFLARNKRMRTNFINN